MPFPWLVSLKRPPKTKCRLMCLSAGIGGEVLVLKIGPTGCSESRAFFKIILLVGQIYGIDLCSELELEDVGSRAEVRGPKGRALGGILGKRPLLTMQLDGLGELKKLPQWGPGRSPGRCWFWGFWNLAECVLTLETATILLFSFKTSKLELSLLSLSGYGTDVNDCILRARLLNVH